jgi:hypothetical protein
MMETGAFRIQNLYPMLVTKLKARGLHFLVPPYNASAQVCIAIRTLVWRVV